MCGGFSCSKNALIALNILYVVSKSDIYLPLLICFHRSRWGQTYNYYQICILLQNSIQFCTFSPLDTNLIIVK